MKWRLIPPVLSPIAPRSLARATAAALGLRTPPLEPLTRQISLLFDAPETLLTDSGTSALALALEGTVAPGSLVAMPGYACIDIIAAAIRARVRVLLYDVDPETLSPDLDSVREALGAGARALVVAPLFGYPADMTALVELAKAHGVPLIEDAAQGAGGLWGGKVLGTFGDVSVLSFGRGKGMTAGAGGALLVRRPALLDWARHARSRLGAGKHGATQVVVLGAQWLLARPSLYAIPSSIPMLKLGEMVYHPAPEPRGLSAAAAAVLPDALALAPHEVRARRGRAEAILGGQVHSTRFTPIRPLAHAQPGYLRLALIDSTGTATPDPSLGVFRGYPVTLDQHPETQRVLARPASRLGGARHLRDRLFTAPAQSRVGARDSARLREWLGFRAPALQPEASAV